MTTKLDDPIAEAQRQWRAHGWGEAATGMAAVTSVVRVHQLLLRRVHEALLPFDLTLARFEVLRLLGFSTRGEMPLGKLSAKLQVNAGSITNAVDRLERDGLVERRAHVDDGRVVLAALTAEGRRVVDAATPALNDLFVDLGLEPATLAGLVDTLADLRAANGDPH